MAKRHRTKPQSEADLYDILFSLANPAESINRIAQRLGIRKEAVVERVKEAFQNGVIHLPFAENSRQASQLRARFREVSFRIIAARHEFYRVAAWQILTWIHEILSQFPEFADLKWRGSNPCSDPRPYIAIGGGETMNRVLHCAGEVLLSSEGDAIRRWLSNERPFCIVNATAGGRSRKPEHESSRLACLAGEITGQDVGLFSVSPRPSKDESELTSCAVLNTTIVLSGIGEPQTAYCIKVLEEQEVLSHSHGAIAAEFLFHLFTSDGHVIEETDATIETKENSVLSEKTTNTKATLARLLDWRSLKGRPSLNRQLESSSGPVPRYVMAVATCDTNTKERKARALYTLLANGYFTHVCISAELAEAVELESQRPD